MRNLKLKPVWKEFLLAGGIGILLTGVFIIPFLHFWPNFNKAIDPRFESAQAIQYIPLTWIIDNVDIFRESLITPQPHAYLYINYIGWIPILFSLVAIRLVPRSKVRLLAFFLVALLFVLIASSGFFFASLMNLLPQVIAGIRNTPLIAGLSVPLILALAAWGLDCALRLNWPTLSLKSQSGKGVSFKVTWLVLAIPLIWSIRTAYQFSQDWLHAYPPPAEVAQINSMIELDGAQWINPPYGELYWLPALLDQGHKLTNVVRPWNWKGNSNPPGHLVALRDYSGVLDDTFLGEAGGVSLFNAPAEEYAAVQTVNGVQPCHAEAIGGHIDVTCETDIFGDLTVQEHSMRGWSVTIDGEAAQLRDTQWLNVFAPEGKHVYEFRYRPWDVPLGALVSLLGVLVVIWFWIKSR